MAYAELGQLDDAWRCIDDAIETMERSKEKWGEAEVHRIAGEIALKSLAPDPEKAEAYFDRALAVAREQQAKFWELRAAMIGYSGESQHQDAERGDHRTREHHDLDRAPT
jgi:predicted ATPase